MEADGIRHPDYDDHQVLLAAVRLRYGDELVPRRVARRSALRTVIDLAAGFLAVTQALEVAGVRYVVVGSMAAARWGVARTTRDIDLVLVVNSDLADAVLTALDRDDIYFPRPAAAAARSSTVARSTCCTRPAGARSMSSWSAPTMNSELFRLDRRVRADVVGVVSWVATAEDVILAKLRWRLESPGRSCNGATASRSPPSTTSIASTCGVGLRNWASSTIWPTCSANHRAEY